MRKGASEIISTILMVLVSTVAVAVVLMIGMPAIDRAKEAGITNEAGKNIQVLDDTIREVASEGVGSLRTPRLQISDGDYRIFNYSGNNSGAVEFRYSMNYNSFPLLGVQVDGNIKTSTGLSTRGLIGYWRLNKINSTNYTLDDSGKGNDGPVVTGSEDVFNKQVSGKYGYGLSFDGSDDYVNCGNDTSLNPTQAITVETWVKFTTLHQSTAYPYMVAKYTSEFDRQYYVLFVNSSKTLEAGFVISNDYKNVNGVKSDFAVDQWYHVVWTYDVNGGTNNNKLYVNGILDLQDTYTDNMVTSVKPVIIGSSNGTADFFNGSIDEVKIYNRALTADEVQENFGAKQSDFRITVEYDKIDVMGSAKFGKGTQKICIEKTGSEGTKAVVSVSVC